MGNCLLKLQIPSISTGQNQYKKRKNIRQTMYTGRMKHRLHSWGCNQIESCKGRIVKVNGALGEYRLIRWISISPRYGYKFRTKVLRVAELKRYKTYTREVYEIEKFSVTVATTMHMTWVVQLHNFLQVKPCPVECLYEVIYFFNKNRIWKLKIFKSYSTLL